jgi:hypothetical protein
LYGIMKTGQQEYIVGGQQGMDAGAGMGPGGTGAGPATRMMTVTSWPHYSGWATPGKSGRWSGEGGGHEQAAATNRRRSGTGRMVAVGRWRERWLAFE